MINSSIAINVDDANNTRSPCFVQFTLINCTKKLINAPEKFLPITETSRNSQRTFDLNCIQPMGGYNPATNEHRCITEFTTTTTRQMKESEPAASIYSSSLKNFQSI